MTYQLTVDCPDCGMAHDYPCTDGTCDCCEAIVKEHVSEVMWDTHDANPDCLLCQHGVTLGAWERYGYPNGPWEAKDA